MKRLAAMLLDRALGAERARSILGDLEEDLARGRSPRWASRAEGAWLLGQAITYMAGAACSSRAWCLRQPARSWG